MARRGNLGTMGQLILSELPSQLTQNYCRAAEVDHTGAAVCFHRKAVSSLG